MTRIGRAGALTCVPGRSRGARSSRDSPPCWATGFSPGPAARGLCVTFIAGSDGMRAEPARALCSLRHDTACSSSLLDSLTREAGAGHGRSESWRDHGRHH